MKIDSKSKNKLIKKGVYTTAILGGMLLAPYVADELGVHIDNVFENEASALEGTGENYNPYVVSTKAELYEVMSKVSTSSSTQTYIQLGADIDMGMSFWTPVGTSSKPVYVNFDGKGHTIKGLIHNSSAESYIGLFGHMKASIVTNVVFDSPWMLGGAYVGVVAGKAQDSVFSNITVNGGRVSASKNYAGGIVGGASSGVALYDINVNGITITGDTGHVGGVAGDVSFKFGTNNFGVDNIYVNAEISSDSTYVGGVFGEISNTATDMASATNAVVEGSVKGKSYVGGIAGKISKVDMAAIIAYNSVTGTTDYIGGLAGSTAGDMWLRGFVANQSINNTGTGKNVGLVMGSAGTATVKNYKAATVSDSAKYKDNKYFNTFHMNLFQDTSKMNTFFKFTADSYSYTTDGGEMKGLDKFYFDVNTKKMRPLAASSDEDILNSFASSEYQEVFNTVKADALNKLETNATGSSATSSYSVNMLNWFSPEYLFEHMDTKENEERLRELFSPLGGAYYVLSTMRSSWGDNTVSSQSKIFQDVELGTAYLNSTIGNDSLNKFMGYYENGTYAMTDEKTAMFNAFKALKTSPTQTNYNNFVEADKLDKTEAKGDVLLTAIAEYYKKVNNLQDYVDMSYQNAVVAVENAEATPNEENLNVARSKVELVTDATQKKELTNRLDVVEAVVEATKAVTNAIDAVTKAEASKTQADVNAAKIVVNSLPAGEDKTSLTERLNVVQQAIDLEKATTAIVKAEGSKSQTDVNAAKTLINALPDGDDKAALTERMNVVQKAIDDAKAIADATNAVVKAENSKLLTDVSSAKELVTVLPVGIERTDLINRLNTLQRAIYTANATALVEKAEASKSQADVDIAFKDVNKLLDEDAKGILDDRLTAVQSYITAKVALEKVENNMLVVDVAPARELIMALTDGDDKDGLWSRLIRANRAIYEKQATELVVKAEDSKTQADVDAALEKVNELANEAEKVKLSDRLTAVQKNIDDAAKAEADKAKAEAEKQQAIQNATDAVMKAESSKVQADVDNARSLVNNLPDGEEKTSLNERVEIVQKSINDAKGEAEKQKAIDDAKKAVEKAEGSQSQSDIDDALAVLNSLPDGEEKDNLVKRLDVALKVINDAKVEADKQKAIQDATDAVAKAEGSKAQSDVEDARTIVNNLPDGEEKTALTERLNTVQKAIEDAKAEEEKQKAEAEKAKAIQDATDAVAKAEGAKSQANVDKARAIVNDLPDGEEKTALTERLNVAQKAIDDAKAKAEEEKQKADKEKEDAKKQKALEEATDEVVNAETSKTSGDVQKATRLVNALPNGDEKTALKDRLAKVNEEIKAAQEVAKENQLTSIAQDAVEKAEKAKDSRSILTAKLAVNKLKDGEVKDALNNQIKAVEDVVANAESIKTAEKAIERAEKTRSAKDINDAIAQVNKVAEGSSKEDLMKRVNAIEEYDSQYEAAKKLVEMMEKNPNAKNVDTAQKAVEKVKNETRKAELQKHIDAVNAAKNEKALENAGKLIADAEKEKTSISVINAQKALDEVAPSVEKDALQERVNAVNKEIQKMNEDLSTFVVDEEVLKAIDDIKDESARKALKSWKTAVENGEKYFSNNMVRSIEKTVPTDEILNNADYALIVHQLQARSASLIQGGQEYTYIYQLKIRDAFDNVLKFEAKPDEKRKASALKAIDIVNKSGNVDNVFVTVLKARVNNIQF